MIVSGWIKACAGSLLCVLTVVRPLAQSLRLHDVTIVQSRQAAPAEIAAADLLSSEVKKRTGDIWKIAAAVPASGDAIVLRVASSKWTTPFFATGALSAKPESYRISSLSNRGRTIITIEGIDQRGELFGVGKLLRMIKYATHSEGFTDMPSCSSSPDKSIRGHQLGYRNTANSYDGWSKQQFEQYIRDLVVFGNNSIESIPIFDESTSPHFQTPPMEMNAFISSVCKKFDLDYWMWVPAQFDCKDTAKRHHYLATFEKICQVSPKVNGVFFPGGDPGDNPPELVIPLLKDMYAVLKKYHPEAKMWLSLQGFTTAQNNYVYRYIREQQPSWLGGIVTGPSSPTARETRLLLPARYKIRHYPDVTHNVRCEFEIPWWDPSFSFTLGREAINPRPCHYAAIYREMQPYIDGFISYSDGIHDDVNKIVWSCLAWDGKQTERNILQEYTNYFFNTAVADDAADGILSLEKNWQGPMVANGAITSTFTAWQQLQKKYPELDSNWRWQMNLLRATYDHYTRLRFLYETTLEQQANRQLMTADSIGADSAMAAAKATLNKKITDSEMIRLRQSIVDWCDKLYHSISLQTSVSKYQASGLERGAVLDFIDHPLNNRWWLEDQFDSIRALPEAEKRKALQTIATWEDPGPGGCYDQVGNIGRSPHEMKGEGWMTDPVLRKSGNPGYDFSNNGMSRKRLSWLTYMRWPLAMEYNDVDSAAAYSVRITGLGESLLKVNGQRVTPSRYGKAFGEIKEYPVPPALIKQGRLVLTWDDVNEDYLNWRKQSRVCEVWLIKNP